MDIVACTDRWFVMPTGVMMYSVCVNNPDADIVFHIITDDNVTDGDQHDLEDVVASFEGKSVVFYPVSEQIAKIKFPALDNQIAITRTTYYRFWLTEFLPPGIDKVLYLDGDIIVRHSLLPLWNTNIEGFPVGAVTDGLEGNMEFYQRFNYASQLGYFNAGVLLVNLKYWREHEMTITFMRYIQEHADTIKFHDQDVLNVLFSNNKVVLPIKYNLTTGFLWKSPQYDYNKYMKDVDEARRDPVIVHYAGNHPWDCYNRCPHPFASTFYKYQSQTKWKGIKIDKRTFKLRVINYVADTLRKYGLKSQLPTIYEYIDITPID